MQASKSPRDPRRVEIPTGRVSTALLVRLFASRVPAGAGVCVSIVTAINRRFNQPAKVIMRLKIVSRHRPYLRFHTTSILLEFSEFAPQSPSTSLSFRVPLVVFYVNNNDNEDDDERNATTYMKSYKDPTNFRAITDRGSDGSSRGRRRAGRMTTTSAPVI